VLSVRVGHGYDLHRLAASDAQEGERGKAMVLGGVRFESDRGPVAHSDGDALLHAITDAILGALAMPDIGQLFPDSDPKWAGADSEVFLVEAVKRAAAKGWVVGNVDATVILERPKLGPRKEEVRRNVARILGVEVSSVNVKGKTHEKVDAVGEGRAVEVHAVVVMVRK
jgi:2-C-methyl-D-erythritol 2,4-cyclodiphosphate synthase